MQPSKAPNLALGLTQWFMRNLAGMLKAFAMSFWGWYRQLGMLPMFMATVGVAVVGLIALSSLGLGDGLRQQAEQLLEGGLVITFLLVLIVGMVRGR